MKTWFAQNQFKMEISYVSNNNNNKNNDDDKEDNPLNTVALFKCSS